MHRKKKRAVYKIIICLFAGINGGARWRMEKWKWYFTPYQYNIADKYGIKPNYCLDSGKYSAFICTHIDTHLSILM